MQKLHSLKTSTYLATIAVFFLATLPLLASAQQLTGDGIEITRNATDLTAVLRDHPTDPNVLDTALILTNQTGTAARARCIAYGHGGQTIGRAWLKLPANGMRIVLASDITQGGNFVGSIRCKARGHVVGSAFILGAVFSAAQVNNATAWNESRISAPVVVAY